MDDAALRRVRGRMASAVQPPWLHAEVARRMADRLPIILRAPRTVIDWYAADGASAEPLRAACPRAARVAVDLGDGGAAAAQPPWWSPQRWRPASPPMPADTLPAAAGDLLWANMGLHWCADPLAEMRRWHRVLAVDGFLMFATLGPGTLESLRALYASLGWPSPHAPFVDMHDLGDMLVQAGFADPVMDQETLTLSWADSAALLAELRSLGGNVDPARFPGLRTPRWRDALCAALQPAGADRPALAFEIVYGHAFRPAPRPRLAAETQVDLEDMRSILRSGSRP
jgi:malonyl-CoA O-methyltransferase